MAKIKECRIKEGRSLVVIEQDGNFYSAMEDKGSLHFVREFEKDKNSAYSDYYQRAANNGVVPED